MIDETVSIASADDSELRAAFASVAELAGTGTPCPTADALWESAAGHDGRREREAVIIHLGECTACAAAWRLARDLQREGANTTVLAGPSRWFRRTWVQLAAVAAVLVIAVGVGVQFRSAHQESPSEFRGQEGDWIQSLIPEGKPLPRDRCLLRWTPGPERTVYHVRVTTEDLVPVARSRGSTRAEFLVPRESLSLVPLGSRIVWQVTAYLPDGTKADSRSFTTGVR